MTLSLILNNGQPVVRRRAGKLENLPPSVAIVYPVEHGPWETETRRDRSPTQRFLHANKDCYVVDLSDHRRTGRLSNTPLTCSDGGHRFEATFDVGFRVHDPVQVVRGNVRDALAVVYGYLTARMRVYAAQFAIDRAVDAQDHMNRAFATAMPLPEGITIYHCTVLIEPDAAARVFVQQLLEAERGRVLGREKHRTAEGQTHSGERLKDIQHEARIRREQQERQVLAGLQLDFRGMILEHLAKHPADTEQAMNLLMRLEESKVARAEIREERHVEMVKYLIEKGVVREIDLPGLRRGALGGAAGMDPLAAPLPLPLQLSGPGGGGQGAGGGPGPAGQQVPAPVRWGGSGGSQTPQVPQSPQSPQSPQAPQSPPATGLMPVYVVLDVSPGAAGCRIELANALRSLQTALVNSPDVASAIRVSVLTYAEGAEVLMPLVELTWGTSVPELVPGTACRYRPVFQRLLELLPLDMERLKEQVPRVLRPVVFFLTAQPAEDGGDWPAVHAELMRHHYHPHLVVCGIGAAARPDLTGRLASLPELGVVAVPGSDLSESAVRFSVLLQNTVLHLGRSALAGRMELHLECPEGLTPGTTLP
ncbi:vWA domain-containing protein [Streptomyces sp. NPDC055749]